METVILPNPPSTWDELTEEQLIYIHTLLKEDLPESVYKMRVFLSLCGLELCGKSFFTHEDQLSVKDNLSVEELNIRLAWMEKVIRNEAPVTIVLKKKGDEESPLMTISAEDFFYASEHFTNFLDEPFTLTDCHIDTIRIGSHTYKGPDPMLLSLTYEQFQNAQTAASNVQSSKDNMDMVHKKMLSELKKLSGENKNLSQEELYLKLSPQLIRNIESCTKDLKDAQGEFISSVLVPMEAVVMETEVYDDDVNIKIDNEGNIVTKKEICWQTKKYDYHEMQRLKDEIADKAPDWLFPILYQWFQGSLLALQKKFPKLFSGKNSQEEYDPIKSFVQTLNTLMKEQGFPSQRAVLDADAILNFETLNRLTIQAEEITRMRKKIKT